MPALIDAASPRRIAASGIETVWRAASAIQNSARVVPANPTLMRGGTCSATRARHANAATHVSTMTRPATAPAMPGNRWSTNLTVRPQSAGPMMSPCARASRRSVCRSATQAMTYPTDANASSSAGSSARPGITHGSIAILPAFTHRMTTPRQCHGGLVEKDQGPSDKSDHISVSRRIPACLSVASGCALFARRRIGAHAITGHDTATPDIAHVIETLETATRLWVPCAQPDYGTRPSAAFVQDTELAPRRVRRNTRCMQRARIRTPRFSTQE